MDKNNSPILSGQISIIEILSFLWSKRAFLIKTVAIVTFLGLVLAFVNPKEWRSRATVFVDSSMASSLTGSLGGIASLAGINLPESGGGGIDPAAYEDILKSNEFVVKLMNSRFYYGRIQDSIMFSDYCEEYLRSTVLGYAMAIPGKIIGLVKSKEKPKKRAKAADYLYLSEKEELLYGNIKNRIYVGLDDDKSILSISFLIQDPLLAAQLTEFSLDYLQNYLLDYVTRAERKKFEFVQQQYLIKEKVFKEAQDELATFLDSNLDLSSNSSKVEEQRLRSNYDLAFDVYLTLAKSYEDAQIALNEKSETLQRMGPIQVPADEAKPKKLIVLLVSVFFSLFMGVAFLLVRQKWFELMGKKG